MNRSSSRLLLQVLAAPVVVGSLFLLPASVAQTNQAKTGESNTDESNWQWAGDLLPESGASFAGAFLATSFATWLLGRFANLEKKIKKSSEEIKDSINLQIDNKFKSLNVEIDKRFAGISKSLNYRNDEVKGKVRALGNRISELFHKG